MRLAFITVFLFLLYNATCQQIQSSKIIVDTILALDDIIIYANKFPEKRNRVAQTVHVLKEKSLLNFQPNTADALINSGAVFVQKSQQSGGSPVIRGFEASRVLLMIDGVRMNNAIYRAGHLQNIITVDNSNLERIEILFGPSSTLYGSDALGGVISMQTKNPVLNSKISSNYFFRYASATNEFKGHIDFNFGGKKWASLTSITNGKFGDLIQGNNRSSEYPDFGKKFFYVDIFNNNDSAFVNSNPNKQISSSYNQIDFTEKIMFQPKINIQHLLNIQFSNSSNIPRYDRLSEINGGSPIFAEWFYGPQKRNLVAYHFNANKLHGFFKEIKLTTNYQNIEESRITRRFKNNNKDFRWEKVNVYGLNLDAKHYSNKNEFHFGIESYYNTVSSTAERKNIITNAVSKISTRYSDGPTNMLSNALFVQHTLKISDKLTLNDGVRFNSINLNATFIDTGLLHLPFTNTTQNNFAVTGNIGLVYASEKKLRLAFLLSSGFRNPNVDDLTKVFDTRTGYVVVPNNNIKPEYTYNAEFNFNKLYKDFSFGGSIFYTKFSNAIVVDKFLLNGQSNILFQGVLSDVYAPQNKAHAYLYGFSLNTSINISTKIKADAIYTYTYGRYTNNGITIPLDHIPPTYGKISFTKTFSKGTLQFNTLFNGWKKIENYNLNGEDNEQYATKDGMPSWIILNLQLSLQLNKNIALNITFENILDKNYRYFASGISAPGRNFILSFKTSF